MSAALALPQNAQRASDGTGTYPVQYSSRLSLSSGAEISERLQSPFPEGTAHPTGIENCAQFLAKCKPGSHDCGASADREFLAQRSTLADCTVLAELEDAKPARRSSVADLKWDERVLQLLPPQLSISVSEEARRAAELAAQRGESWPKFDTSAHAEAKGMDQVEVRGKGFSQRLVLWGRGDFNGDGVEDLLVQSLDTLTEGTYRNTRLFILTRKTPHGKLSVVRVIPL
jgi:hypothetical protein